MRGFEVELQKLSKHLGLMENNIELSGMIKREQNQSMDCVDSEWSREVWEKDSSSWALFLMNSPSYALPLMLKVTISS